MKKLLLVLLAFGLALLTPMTVAAWAKDAGADCERVFANIMNDTGEQTLTADGYVKANSVVVATNTDSIPPSTLAEVSWTPTPGFVGTVEAYIALKDSEGEVEDSSEKIIAELNCPAREPAKGSSLGTTITCTDPYIQATMDLKDNGVGVANVKVTFSYNSVVREAFTNNDGRAQVGYLKDGEHALYATADGGYPAQSQHILMPVDCPTPPSVGGPAPQVPALAPTGLQEELTLAGQLALLISGQVGAGLLLRKKFFAKSRV